MGSPPSDVLVELQPGDAVEDAVSSEAQILGQLEQVSRAFASGWNERRRPKERRGEGLSWDSRGFEAP